MQRLHDWHARLTAYLVAAAQQPFAEGRHDCALFAAGALEAMTGEDPAAAWRGRYSSTRGGLRVLRKAGHADHLALASSLLEPIPPAFASMGDIAAVQGEGGPALGVVTGEAVAVLTLSGMGFVPLLQAVQAWRVPQ
jgi:hypothetical protein